jgi:5'-nucleotidase
MLRSAVLLIVALAFAQSASALNILLTNDDGFETANIHALYERLKTAGYDVIISAPTQNNSGKGGAVNFLRPINALTQPTRWGTVPARAPGVGADPANPADVFYVDGTPVMSLLYGLDVVGAKRWHGQPDLVISGPNEGNNTGYINNSSGTVANALYGINRGVPSIAVSYAATTGRSYVGLAANAIEYEVADIVVRIVRELEQNTRSRQPLLPAGVGLNVNIPMLQAGQGRTASFRLTRIGLATLFSPVFFERLSDSARAAASGLNVPLPGISLLAPGESAPAGVKLPTDDSPRSEAHATAAGQVAISVIQGVPQAPVAAETRVGRQLRDLFKIR